MVDCPPVNVIAVIGDVTNSRGIARREAFQRKLATSLQAASTAAGSALASPYTITLGDEFQAVYRRPETLWAELIEVLAEIHPVQARFAIGVGELTTRINPEQALGMDGPAFHRARDGIERLKEQGGTFMIVGDDPAEWALANHALALWSHSLQKWSRNRLQILAGLLRDRPVRELEAELSISRVAVYKNIHAAALDDVIGICHELSRALDRTRKDA